ncbi:NAD(P)H-dependent oxidoreductase subunit E [Bacillota bacterium LX-D]|nr:NAD(P)H-dependent oxidoreductase subunit E [Bacillota bacterium LX-D]
MCKCDQPSKKILAIIREFKKQEGALIPLLHAIQKELGYLPKKVLETVAVELKIPLSSVYGTATFYSLFSTTEKAQNIIRVCESGPCHVSGYQEILETIKNELGIDINQATPDKKFYLEKCACLGVCAETPAIMINDQTYVNLTPLKVRKILANF